MVKGIIFLGNQINVEKIFATHITGLFKTEKRPQFKEKNGQEHEQTRHRKKIAVALKHKRLFVLTCSGVHIVRTILLLWNELQVIWKIGRISQEQ